MFIDKSINYGRLKTLDQVFDDLFGKAWSGNWYSNSSLDTVSLESETDTSSVFRFDLPDYEKNEVSVTIKNETMYIKAKNGDRVKEATSYLPKGKYDTENINAKLKNGVLRITVPKKVKELPKQLEIKVE